MLEHIDSPEGREKVAKLMASWNIRVLMAKALFLASLGVAGLVWAIKG